MPNIVRNKVIVAGPKDDLKAFIDALSVKDGTLYYKGSEASAWEVKLDQDQPGAISIYALSAWGPPHDDVYFVSSEFPALTFYHSYHGDGPVYGSEVIRGGKTVMTARPQKYSEFVQLVDLVDRKYDSETFAQFEDRKREHVHVLVEGYEDYEKEMREWGESRQVSTPTIMGLWFAGIGALGAYTYLKK
jgi:hypothetical protein